MKYKLWQDWVILAAAAWLFVSPFALGFASFDHPAAWVAIVLSVFLFASAAEALVVPDQLEEWVDIAIGFAIMVSPWIFEFKSQAAPSLDFVAVGFVVTICAMGALGRDMQADAERRRLAHG